MKNTIKLALCLLTMAVVSCVPDNPVAPVVTSVGKGVFVINEGNFGYANSTLTFYDPMMDTVANNLFCRVNGVPIGDTGQSLCLLDGKLYIVVNASNCIRKVDAATIVCDTTQPYMLTDFVYPRYMLPVAPNKAYVSDLASTLLWIVNPQDMTHSGSVSMGKSTETMVQLGQELYVTNWSRAYLPGMENNTVQVVDINNDIKVADITVGMEPKGMVVDKNGMVWVLCEGDSYDILAEVSSTLWRIDPQLKTATLVKSFERCALNLAIDPTGSYLYYIYGGDYTHGGDLCRFNIDSQAQDESFKIEADGRMFYSIAVNPGNGDIYLSDAKTYVQDGTVYRYSSDGVLLSSFDAGICPGFMLFN